MTAQTIDLTANVSTPSAPYSIDTSKGGHDGNVSRQWMSRPADQRFGTLTQLYNKKKDDHERSWTVVRNNGLVEVAAPPIESAADLAAGRHHDLNLLVDRTEAGSDVQRMSEVAATHWSFGQLCSLVKAPAGHYRTLATPIVADALNYGLRFNRPAENVQLYGDDDFLMAATGENYGRIPDHEVVKACMEIAGDGLGNDPRFHWKTPGRIDWMRSTYDPEDIGPDSDHTFFGSDRDLFVFLVDDRRPITVGKTRDGKDDHMFRGFYIQNSMVGSRSLKLKTFMLRGICMNRNIWGQEGVDEITIRHTSLAPDRWLQQCVPALEAYAQQSDRKLIEEVQQLKAAEIAKKDEEIVAFLKARNFSAQAAKTIMETHEKEEGAPIRTAWDAVQGITAYARDRGMYQDERLDIENAAAKIANKVLGNRSQTNWATI